MTSFTLTNNFKSGVATLLKTLFIISFIINIGACILLIIPIYFSTEVRTLIIIVCTIPSYSFLLGHFFYESYLIAPITEFYFKAKSFFGILALLFPPMAFAFRYDILNGHQQEYITVTALGFLVFFFFQIPLSQNNSELKKKYIGKFYFHIRFIMRDFWIQKENPILIQSYDKEKRERHYAKLTDLKVFQQTLTCAIPDSKCALNFIPQQWDGKEISVLDIGGGDGCFSKLILDGLKKRGCSFSRLSMIDPASWNSIYKNNLFSIIPDWKIEITNTTFKDYEKKGNTFDLVIASHSLYAELDYYANDLENIINNVIIPLKSLVKKNGFIIIVMASMKGISYRFKKQSIDLLFGNKIVDATSEVLWQAFQRDRDNIQIECSDSVIDLTELWSKYKSNEVEPLYSWLSYFLRYDIRSLSELEKDMIVEFLNNNLLRFDRLANVQKEYYKTISSNFNQNSFVLPHKVEILRYNG